MIIYDNQFNANEWFIIIALCIGVVVMVFIPKRFPPKISIVFFMSGVFTGFLFDHSLSVEPVSFYDVNDKSTYQLIDFLSYLTYGPYSYLFFHFYDRIKPKSFPLYVLIWTLFSFGMEWFETWAGVFHYRHGYKMYYNIPIYLVVLSLWVIIYHRYQGISSKNKEKIRL